MGRIRNYNMSYSKKGYAVGDRNGNSKLTNEDITLMLEYRDSCQNEVDEIDRQIELLKDRKATLKKQMTRRYIADMFEISTVHCERIFRGDQRGSNGSIQ